MYAGSKRPGECAKRTFEMVPGTSGHQLVDGSVGELEVGGEVAEQVEGHGRRP
jgi:hypothetical protein